jgi:hypothetical protein
VLHGQALVFFGEECAGKNSRIFGAGGMLCQIAYLGMGGETSFFFCSSSYLGFVFLVFRITQTDITFLKGTLPCMLLLSGMQLRLCDFLGL